MGNFWKATLGAFGAAFVVIMIVNGILLMPTWQQMGPQGFLRAVQPAMVTLLIFAILEFIAVYIMCEFLEKMPKLDHMKAHKYGAMFGVLIGIPIINEYLFYKIPEIVPAVSFIGAVIAFSIAGGIYYRLQK